MFSFLLGKYIRVKLLVTFSLSLHPHPALPRFLVSYFIYLAMQLALEHHGFEHRGFELYGSTYKQILFDRYLYYFQSALGV